MQRGQSKACASFDSIAGIFETRRIIPNVAARLPADVTRCAAELSATDEMSALIYRHLHHDSDWSTLSLCYVKVLARWPVPLLVDKKTKAAADPVLVDRRSGRPLNECDFVFSVGPAASERTRRRYAVIKEKQFAAQQSSRPVRSSLEGRKRRAS